MHPVTFIYKVKRRLRRKGEQLCPKLFFAYGSGPSSPDRFFEQFQTVVPFLPMVDLKERLSGAEQKGLIQKADAICDHTFDLLGSGPYHFKNGIDWHLDFKSGFRWSEHLVHSSVSGTTRLGEDIKVPWELSRFNHAVTLGLAYQFSNDRKYAEEFVRQAKSWMDENLVGRGVNWACPMDVAIRAVNWLVAFSLFFDVLMTEEFKGFRQKLSSNLWRHARFINSHLEWLGPKADAGANHLLSDLAGLFTLGLFFNETKTGWCWFRFAQKQLERQMTKQVFPDGVHFECSPSYHRLCLEVFMWCGSLAQRFKRPFSGSYYTHLQKMNRFVADYIKPSGLAPLIGDNDDGRLLSSALQPMGDHRYLAEKQTVGQFFVDRFLLDGETSVSAPCSVKSVAYPGGGFYFLKNDRAQVAVRAGRLAYAGGHAHNDQLSFELTLDGQDVFVDRGAYVYTPDSAARNRYRSTAAHNVMQINESEQNSVGARLFGMKDETRTKVIKTNGSFLRGSHSGFRSLQRSGASYLRTFDLKSDCLLISDSATGLQSGDILKWGFHLAPGLQACLDGEIAVIENGATPMCRVEVPKGVQASILDFPHSPSYGVLVEAKVLMMKCRVIDPEPCQNYQFKVSWE